MTMLAVCILLLVVGLALVFLEMFIPSAGILGFLSAAMIVLSVVLAYYYYGPLVGTIFLGVGAIITPIAIGIALRWYPHTTLGRLVMPLPPAPEEVLPLAAITGELQRLKGQIGRSQTPLLPGGTAKVEGKSYSAVSDGEPIDAGALVLVTSVDGTRIIVRRVDEERLMPTSEPERQQSPVEGLLAQPLEAFDLESLDDSLS